MEFYKKIYLFQRRKDGNQKLFQIISHLIPRKMCVKKVDKLCSNKYDTNYYFESLSQYPVQKVIYDKAVTRQENLHKFEDAEIYIYTDFDAYLKTIYGNYM